MTTKQTVTIHDVAQRARVSVSTVSNVLTGNRPVAEATRRTVLQVVEEMGFRPNRLARGLVNRSSQTIGVVASHLGFYGPSTTLAGIERRASELGYSVSLSLLHDPETEDVEPVVATLLSMQVDGIIWAVPQIAGNRRWWQAAERHLPVPVVFINSEQVANSIQVDNDNYLGGRLAADHLLDMGYRRIGLIAGPLTWWAAIKRQQGWQDALAAAGFSAEETHCVEGDWTAASGEYGLAQLLTQYPEMDAVCVGNDQMAVGAMRLARTRGITIPHDLGMVGYDDVPEAEFYYPSLTTVRQSVSELGGLAVNTLAQVIANGEQDLTHKTLLQPVLVARASSRLHG